VAVSSASGLRVYQLSTAAGSQTKGLRAIDTPIVLTRAQLPEALRADGEYSHAVAFLDTATGHATAGVDDVTAGATSSSSRKKKSTGSKASDHSSSAAEKTLLAVHCAKQGVIVLCECLPAAQGSDSAAPELRQVQVIRHRSIVQSRTGSMDRVSEVGLTQAVHKMVFSGDGKFLAVSSCSSKSITYVYDLVRYIWLTVCVFVQA
jgi:hypothetical protein